jgi:hypothetical protein
LGKAVKLTGNARLAEVKLKDREVPIWECSLEFDLYTVQGTHQRAETDLDNPGLWTSAPPGLVARPVPLPAAESSANPSHAQTQHGPRVLHASIHVIALLVL